MHKKRYNCRARLLRDENLQGKIKINALQFKSQHSRERFTVDTSSSRIYVDLGSVAVKHSATGHSTFTNIVSL